ncbi:MAG: hypothetical protein GY749_39765 [Desulfobacteraceae bacterium]|nr:hypothetical protein [Desulfobacteraceae bacterium]
MDEKFLEFWGNFLISTAREKKRADDISNIMQKSITDFNEMFAAGMGELTPMFRKFYGLDKLSEKSDDYSTMTKKAVDDFQKSFKDYMAMMGVFPKEDYLALVEKYEKLKEKCADQEETIRHLRMLLGANSGEQSDAIRSLQDIAKDQSELFQNMIKDFSQFPPGKDDSASKDLSPDQSENKARHNTDIKGELTNGNDGLKKSVETDD